MQTPRTMTSDFQAAHAAAKLNNEPIFVPASIHADDRGWSIMNQFKGVLSPDGQINFSVMYPNVIKAWHRHRKQTDFWLCVHGNIKVGIHDEKSSGTWMAVIGEKRPGVMIIPPHLWHGAATIGSESAGLLYFVTQSYNPVTPDEDRRAHDSVAGFRWGVRHG